jgi:hypothetical protein
MEEPAYVKHYLDNIDNIPEEWSIRFQQSDNFAKPPRRVFGSNDWEATWEEEHGHATKFMKSSGVPPQSKLSKKPLRKEPVRMS